MRPRPSANILPARGGRMPRMNCSRATAVPGDACSRIAKEHPQRYSWTMIGDIRRRVETVPFAPFAIVTSSGTRYSVPTRDHLNFNPKRTRVIVWLDDDTHVEIAPLHISSLEIQPVPDDNGAV